MASNLPAPDEILEELADKVAGHIDRRAPVAFDRALGELTRYHRFLLAMSASRTSDGMAVSFAEVAGDLWGAPHQEWIRQYRRLFERAADNLPNDAHFLTSLVHVPGRLLGSGDPELPASIVRVILDLGPMMMHRLEAWVTKRTTVETPKGQAAEPRLALVGSDAKAYAGALPEIVGAWEGLLQRLPSIYNWEEQTERSDALRWSVFQRSWPSIWQHLANTAYCLAVAVWNEDEAGTTFFRDALVRWPDHLKYRLDDTQIPRQRRLIFPDLMGLNWAEATAKAVALDYDYVPPPSPEGVFWNVAKGAHDDVLFLTSAVLLSWTIDDKQSSDIGGRTARGLLQRVTDEEDDLAEPHTVIQLRSLLQDLIRTEIAGERLGSEPYGAVLDDLVRSLDNMTERRVVPGRVYSPSTMNGRYDLLAPVLAILCAGTPLDGDDGVTQVIADLADEEAVLPGRDRSLRDVSHELERLQAALTQSKPQIGRGAGVLVPGQESHTKIERLSAIVESAREVLEAKRIARLRARPVDGYKLEVIRSAVEAALLEDPRQVSLFGETEVARTTGTSNFEVQSLLINGVAKGAFVEPPMQAESSGFTEMVVSRVRDFAGGHVWSDFVQRKRVDVEVAAKLEDEEFWRSIETLIPQVGAEPMLVVSRRAALRTRKWLRRQHSSQAPSSQLRVERRERKDNSYVVTIQGVDVYQAEFSPGVSWLFSARALQRIQYAALEPSDQYVTISFDPGDDVTGTMRLSFRQDSAWKAMPIFDIRGQDPDEE